MSPSVSVIIPTFNRLELLKEAVDSVLTQTFSDFELIVIDDGSTDGTDSYLKTIRDDRLRVHVQPNRGVSNARNEGIAKAVAPWIALLDSDDLWLPQKLEVQKRFADENPQVRILQTEETWIRDGVRVNPKHKHRKHSGWIFDQCIPLCIISPSAVMIHREVFDKCGVFDEDLPACEDYDLWLRIALDYPVVTLSDPLIIKRGGHADQLSRRYWGMDRFRVRALQKILSHPRLGASQRKNVEESIESRLQILNQGAQKRGRSSI